MSLAEICRLIQDSPTGTAIRESIWVFPIVETLHVIGLSLSVGRSVLVDLRLIGARIGQLTPLQLMDRLSGWYLPGFALMFVTGALLFWSAAFSLYESPVFRWKLVFLAIAGLNAVLFETTVRPALRSPRTPTTVPPLARLVGWCSLVSWTTVIALGRLTAYRLG
jgi:hypothetical protein